MGLLELPSYIATGDVVADKVTWRTLLRAARRELVDGWSEQDRRAHAGRLAQAGLEHLQRYAAARGRSDLTGLTVTAFEPLRTEPPVEALTAALQRAGVRVLVPLTLAKPRLDWADLGDPARTPLGEQALDRVDLAFVPGLAVSRQGVRLGQGGGYYDTVLPRLRERSGGARAVIVLHDHEVVPQVPADAHDVIVDAVLRASSGVLDLPLG